MERKYSRNDNQREKIRKNILIAQIGRSEYKVTSYCLNRKEEYYETGYTFEAVAGQLADGDVILLAGTEESYWGSLCYYYRDLEKASFSDGKSEAQIRGRNLSVEDAETEVREGIGELAGYLRIQFGIGKVLGVAVPEIACVHVRVKVEEFLSFQLSKKLSKKLRVKIALLEYGRNDEELKCNFQKLQYITESVLDDEGFACDSVNIHFDISNGFRSLPVYIYAFANYLTRIRREEFFLHMYYGMFEAPEKDTDGKKYVHLVNMEDVNNLMLWINAVNEFRSYGSVAQVLEILKENPDWDIFIDEKGAVKLSTVFSMFDYATNANNLRVLEESIDLLMDMKAIIVKYPERASKLTHPERILLENISKDFKERFYRKDSRYPYSLLTIRLAKWYFEQRRIGNAAIAIQEGTITYVMERFPEKVKEYLEENDCKGYTPEPGKLFDYNYRNVIKQLVEKGDGPFFSNYRIIKNDIRNVGAHILYSEVDIRTIDTYHETVEKQIDLLQKELVSPDSDELLFLDLFRIKERKQELQYIIGLIKKMRKDVDVEIDITGISDEKIISGIRLLQEQVQMMKKYYDADDFEGFYADRCRMELLFQIMEKWIESAGAKNDITKTDDVKTDDAKTDDVKTDGAKNEDGKIAKETFRKYFVSARKNIPGYSRLLGFVETNMKNCMELMRGNRNEL